MVKEKSSFVLRRRDNITANEKTAVNSASSSESDEEEYKPSSASVPSTRSSVCQQDSERITRRSTRSSKDSNPVFRIEKDENGQSKDVDNENEPTTEEECTEGENEDGNSNSNESEEDMDAQVGGVRRSAREKKLIYGTYQESWMLGGGPVAKGYPRRADSLEDRRRSSRIVCKPDYFKSDENKNDEDGNESEDMYSRVKKRRTSFSGGTASQVTPENCRRRTRTHSLPGQQDEEPVARRLRDRKALCYNSKTGYRPIQSSRMEELFRKKSLVKRRRQTSSSSSSSDDSDDEQKSPSKKRPRKRFHHGGGQSFQMGQHSKKERMMLMEAQPIAVDPKINFQCVGGLDQFIGKLKEIVLFPLMYSEFYSETNMKPPRGILLHGPPGTGKTLLARALANECSNINGKKVSFFLRKGADLLNKWVGESERQLRVLFQQAAQHQPSIIFFDEIDGLAPVRSSKSDQVHNSIVSTLLAELDGLQDRGQIIVIGSTNRLDFVDPALRRPGRFDCELPIFLPTRDGRRSILKVLVAEWKDPPSDQMLDELADRSIGFSGADLKLLCWTTCMNSLRRTYPQIYNSTKKYILNYSSIKRDWDDWELAFKTVSPSTNRSIFSKYSPAQPLPFFVKPLLQKSLDQAEQALDCVFPWKSLSIIGENSTKRLILCSDRESGVDEYIIPALLHIMETIPVYVLSSEVLFMDNVAAECAVTQICMEVAKHSGPCIMYVPNVDRLCHLLSDSAKEIFVRMITQSLRKPILILATINCKPTASMLDNDFWKLFSGSFVNLDPPSVRSRQSFFEPVLQQATVVKISIEENDVLEELQLAPPESPKKKTLSSAELYHIEKRETAVLRELRIFLREILLKLARNKKFIEFTKPVDLAEVPDYLEVINSPMDLETMMYRLNMGEYVSAGQFLEDVKLIASNCLNYNPHKDESDKRLRMRAYELLDFANTLIEKEMDSDYEEQCKEIIKARDERKAAATLIQDDCKTTVQEPIGSIVPNGINVTPEINLNQSQTSSSTSGRNCVKYHRRKSLWCKGMIKNKKHVKRLHESPVMCSEIQTSSIDEENKKSPAQMNNSSEIFEEKDFPSTPGDHYVICKDGDKYKRVFQEILEETVKISAEFSVVRLLNLRFNLLRLVDQYQFKEEKEELAKAIRILIASTTKNSLSMKILPKPGL